MSAPFFILGTQRSGTTLLFQIFNSHPDLYVVNEFSALYPHVNGAIDDQEGLIRLLVSHLRLPGPYLAEGEPPPIDPFEHVDRAFRAKLESVGKRRWGIKQPRLTYYLDLFGRRYAGAQFVFIVRDARGVVNSYLKRKMNVANVFHGARLWQEQVRTQMRFARKHGAICHLLRYEDLLGEPEARVRAICDFLGVAYIDTLTSYYRKTSETRLHNGNVNITKPVQKSFAEKWRHELSPRQVAVIETVAGDTMKEHGYALVGRRMRLTRLHELGYGWHQWLMTTYWWQRRSRWQGIVARAGRLLDSWREA